MSHILHTIFWWTAHNDQHMRPHMSWCRTPKASTEDSISFMVNFWTSVPFKGSDQQPWNTAWWRTYDVCCFFGGHHFFSNRWSDNKKWYVSYLSIDLGEAPKCRRKNALSEVCYMRTRTDACLASEFLRDLISALPSHVTSLQVGCCEVRTWSWPFISLKAPNPTTSTRLSPPHKPQSYIVQ